VGVLLELLAAADLTFLDLFGSPISLTHRGYWLTVNPFSGAIVPGDSAMQVFSGLGKVVNGEFVLWPASVRATQHTRAETKAAIQAPGGFLSAAVAAHKLKLGIV